MSKPTYYRLLFAIYLTNNTKKSLRDEGKRKGFYIIRKFPTLGSHTRLPWRKK